MKIKLEHKLLVLIDERASTLHLLPRKKKKLIRKAVEKKLIRILRDPKLLQSLQNVKAAYETLDDEFNQSIERLSAMQRDH
jgi:hypothetical protein